jgi:hypothetical protein
MSAVPQAELHLDSSTSLHGAFLGLGADVMVK